MTEDHRRSARVLAENQSTILWNWIEGQCNDRRIRAELIPRDDLIRQATQFLDAMILATAGGDLDNVDIAAYEPLKQVIGKTSKWRMDRGMTRLESTACFICFKDHWLPLLQVEFRHEPDVLGREIIVVCKLNDTLAMNMYEEIVCQGEEQIRKQTKEILEARNHAESANRAKGDFLANMSHELRTPMNGILGMLELTLRSEIDPRHREYLGLARSSAESLLRHLNDILDFSKIEAGKLELETIPFSLRASLDDTMKSLAAHVEEKGLELTYAVDADVPDLLLGDPGRLSQILVNLVGNARKFTTAGEIEVRVERESHDDEWVRLHIAVRDSGIGIAPEMHEHIFAAFSQADCSTTRKYGGTGLGLTICANLAKAMGGQIWVESQLGEGSTFHLTARFGVHHGNVTAPPCQRLNLEGLRVLVVDDNATNRQILFEMLAHRGMKPTPVDGGRAALAAIKRASGAGSPFPLILLDAAMPEMDGFSVAEQINQTPELAGTAILMLSSADLYRDTERCRALGIAVFLRKPIKESDLFDAMSSALSGRQATRAPRSGPTHEPRPAGARSLRILLAEDHPVNQRLAVALLEDAGHSVVVANDGQDAIDKLDRESFDLVLMDVQMPRMDGFQATAAIRAAEKGTGRHMRIIAMTAHAMKGDQERCLTAGMDGYISKPLKAAHFLMVVEGRDKQADAPVADAGSAPVVFDRDEALERALGDHDLLREVADLFLTDCPGLLAEFRSALDCADGHVLELAAHGMKGAAANLSAPRVVALSGRLEELARGGHLAAARSVFDELEHEIGRLADALKVLDVPEVSAGFRRQGKISPLGISHSLTPLTIKVRTSGGTKTFNDRIRDT